MEEERRKVYVEVDVTHKTCRDHGRSNATSPQRVKFTVILV